MPPLNRSTSFFILGVSLGFAVWLFVLDIFGSFPVQSAIWNNGLIEHKMNLANQVKCPKMVIISGSSAIEGISARQIEESLRFRCINWGTSAGFGLHFMLWISKNALKPGDVALLAFEYEHYDYHKNKNIDLTLLQLIASERKEYFDALSLDDELILKMSYNYGYLYKSIFTRYNPTMPPENWARPNYDPWGDPLEEYWSTQIQTPARKANVLNERSRTLINGISADSESWDILTSFVNWCRERNITILATWPNLCYWPDYEESPQFHKTLDRIQRFWESQEVKIVGSPKDAMLESKYFFNGMYHLFEKGVTKRTSTLCKNISFCTDEVLSSRFLQNSKPLKLK